MEFYWGGLIRLQSLESCGRGRFSIFANMGDDENGANSRGEKEFDSGFLFYY